jgi:lysophospholipase L1-like esterase
MKNLNPKSVALLCKFCKSAFWPCIFLLLILLGAEIYLRQVETHIINQKEGYARCISQLESNPDRLIKYTPRGRRLIPNTNVIIKNHQTSGRDIMIRVNSLGFRGPEISKGKLLNQYRILVLGDSITWGDALPEYETYVKRIEESLSGLITSRPIEVVNGGVGDIGTKEEVDILEEQGLQIHPDLVLVEFYLNDSRPPWGFPGEISSRGLLRRYSVLAETIYRSMMLRKWIKDKGEYRFLWIKLQKELDWQHDQISLAMLIKSAQYDWGAAWVPESWEIIDRQFTRLEALSKEKHFKVAIINFPVSFQVLAKYLNDFPQKTAQKLAQEHGFYYFDLLIPLREHAQEDLFYDQCHPKPPASALIGKLIADFLNKEVLQELHR